MAPASFDLDGARRDGYSDTEIADYLAGSRGFDLAGARRDGYSDLEIIGHLNKPPAMRVPGTERTGLPGVSKVSPPQDLGGRSQAFTPPPQPAVLGRSQPAPAVPDYLSSEGATGLTSPRPVPQAPDRGIVMGTIGALDEGIDQTRGMVGAGLEAVGNAGAYGAPRGMQPAFDRVTQAGEMLNRPRDYTPRATFRDVVNNPSVGGAAQWAAESAAQAIPNMATVVGGSILGGPVVGAGLSYLMNVGETYDDWRAKGIDAPRAAMAAGIPQTALDYIEPMRITAAMKGVPLKEFVKESFLRRAGKVFGEGAIESGTEALQKGVGIGAEALLTGKAPDPKEALWEMANEGAAAFLPGAAGGVVQHVAQAAQQVAQPPSPFPTVRTKAPPADLGPVPSLEPPAPPAPVAQPIAPVEPMEAQPVPQAKVDPEELYRDASQYATDFTELGLGALTRKYGISRDEARGILDRLVTDGQFTTKPLKGGGQAYVNLAKKAERGGKPVVVKAPRLEEIAPVVPESAVMPREEVVQAEAPIREEVQQAQPPQVAEGIPDSPSINSPSAPTSEESSLVQQPREIRQIQPDASRFSPETEGRFEVLQAEDTPEEAVAKARTKAALGPPWKPNDWRLPVEETTLRNGAWSEPKSTGRIIQSAEAEIVRRGQASESDIPYLRNKFIDKADDIPTYRRSEGYARFLQQHLNTVQPETVANSATVQSAVVKESSTTQPSGVVRVDPQTIEADPVRFQFKQETGGKAGVNEELKGDIPWNDELAGVVSVWKDPADGKTYVSNGHHRLDLAKRKGVPSINVRYLDAKDAAEARAKGALQNIAEGRGTPVDAAKFMRDTGMTPQEVGAKGISLRGQVARQGVALGKLPQALFDQVVSGAFPVSRAAIIGEGLTSPQDMLAVADIVSKQGMTDGQVREMVRRAHSATRQVETQDTLFGTEETERSLIAEEANLSDSIRSQLSREKKLFATVGTKGAAESLKVGGNVIKAEENKAIADSAAQALEVYDKLSLMSGPVSDAIAQGARELASGAKESTVRESTYAAVRSAVQEALGIREGQGSRRTETVDARRPPAAGAGQRSEAAASRAEPVVTETKAAPAEAPLVSRREKRERSKATAIAEEERKEAERATFIRDRWKDEPAWYSSEMGEGPRPPWRDIVESYSRSNQGGSSIREIAEHRVARLRAPHEALGTGRESDKIATPTEATDKPEPPPSEKISETRLSKAKTAADARLRKRGIAEGSTAGANIFTDPAVIRDMAISIAGSIQRGLIHAKNYVSAITQRFGRAAARVARQVFRRGQAIAARHGDSLTAAELAKAHRITPEQVEAGRKMSPAELNAAADSALASRDTALASFYSSMVPRTAAPPAAKSSTQTTPTTSTQPTSPAATPAAAQSAAKRSPEFERVRKTMEPARTEPDKSGLQKLRETKDKVVAAFTRQFIHLPSGALYAELRQRLNRVTKSKGTATHRAAQAIIDQLEKLSPEEYSTFLDVVALDDLAARVKQSAVEGNPVEDKDLPWGIQSKSELYSIRREARDLARGNPKVVEALRLRKQMWADIKPDYIKAMAKAGYDVSKSVSREDYFRHRVLEHLEAKEMIGQGGTGAGQRFKTPIGRSWLKKAHVNQHAYSLDYIRAEFEVLSEMMYDTARGEFIGWLKNDSGHNIAKDLRKQAAAHNKKVVMPAFAAMAKDHNRKYPGTTKMTAESMYQRVMKSKPKDPGFRRRLTKQLAGAQYIGTLEKAYNEFALKTHGLYQAIDGHHFFMAATISDAMAQAIEANGVGTVLSEQIKKQRVRGSKRDQMVLPREVIETMKEFMQPSKGLEAFTDQIMSKPLGWWKQLKLIHPVSVLKYNIRNLSGDLERVVTVLPGALKHVGKATKEIVAYKKTGHMPSKEFAAWWTRGGMDANLQVAEIGEANKIRKLEHLLVDPKASIGKKAIKAAGKVWEKTWSTTRTLTDMREGVLRYASFLEFQKQIASNAGGRPNTFGTSLRDEVMALRDKNDRAYKLSNDLMLAYDEVSRAGQWIRRDLIPFWSFQEQNARAYTRLVRNAVIDGRTAAGIGYAALGGVTGAARVGAWTAIKVGKTVSLALALKTLTELFNNYAMKDEEDDLPESVRKDTHIVLGRDSNGKVRVFSRIGLVDDLLEWGGLEASPYYVREYLNGHMTIKEMATEMAKSPVNKVVSGLTPIFKIPAEMLMGKSTFPDAFNPRQIRDRGEYIARELGVNALYKKAIGKPQAPLTSIEKALDFILYRYDPKETHYNSFRYDKVPKWGAENGRDMSGGGMNTTRAGEALYDVRMALRYDDQEALAKGLEAYAAAGGNRQNLRKAIDRVHPLGALPKAARKDFEKSLTPKESHELEQAIVFWKEHFDSKRSDLESAARDAGLPAKRKRK